MCSQKAAFSRTGRANSTSDTRDLRSQQYQSDWPSSQPQALGDELLNCGGQSCPEETFAQSTHGAESTINAEQDIGTCQEMLPTPSRNLKGLSPKICQRSKTSSPSHNRKTISSEKSSPTEMPIPFCPVFEPLICDTLKTAMDQPPVTRATLVELDLTWIMHNINLRVDVNFDYDLHFMPIKGRRGDQKRKDAQNYWAALAAEFRVYQHQNSSCDTCRMQTRSSPESFKRRLPKMFECLKELLKTLVPDRDHALVEDNLDVPLMMQQVEKGVLDTTRLAKWLADLLKSHCAPMRDEWADEMALKIEHGTLIGDTNILASGLEKLFSFLEAMKLDVANHQIRTFRFLLIEDTISFQQGFFGKKIREGKMDPEPARIWYETLRKDHCQYLAQSGRHSNILPLESLLHGLLESCASFDEKKALPETFSYNTDRIRQLREDIQDTIYLRICTLVFQALVCRLVGRQVSLPAESYSTLQRRVLAVVDDEADSNQEANWQRSLEHVAMEITRTAFLLCRSSNFPIHDDEFQKIAHCLAVGFSRKDVPSANTVVAELEQVTWRHAQTFQNMSALGMSESQRLWQQDRQSRKPFRSLPDVEDIGRRLAHIGVLHWKIWARLVYLKDDENAIQDDDDFELVQYPISPPQSEDERNCRMVIDPPPHDGLDGVE